MKITNVEAIYVSQRVVRAECDGGQDALIAEFVVQENTGLRKRLTKGHVRMKDGSLAIPDTQGLGLELNEEQVG